MKDQAATACEHDYVFLRCETVKTGEGYGAEWKKYDVFYCRHCTAYRWVHTETQEMTYHGNMRVTWRIAPPTPAGGS